jgi:hypothetical protein
VRTSGRCLPTRAANPQVLPLVYWLVCIALKKHAQAGANALPHER